MGTRSPPRNVLKDGMLELYPVAIKWYIYTVFCLSVCLSVCLLSFHLPVCISVVCLSVCMSVCVLTLLHSTMALLDSTRLYHGCMSVSTSVCLSVYQWSVCLSFCLSVYQCVVCLPLSDLSTSFCSPPNATTVLMEESTSSATLPAVAYAPCSFTVKEAMIYGRVKKRIEENWLHYMYIITGHTFEILEDHNSPLKSLQQGKK